MSALTHLYTHREIALVVGEDGFASGAGEGVDGAMGR